jgi:hypothetical protein
MSLFYYALISNYDAMYAMYGSAIDIQPQAPITPQSGNVLMRRGTQSPHIFLFF